MILKWERLLLIPFLGNYVVNNVAAALVALVPASPGNTSVFTPQYLTFMLLAAITAGLFAWWYLARIERSEALKWGIIFGVAGFVISILTTLISGISGVLAQTGSFAQVAQVLPNFWPFLWSRNTLILLGFWVIPALLVGWYLGRGKSHAHHAAAQPMI